MTLENLPPNLQKAVMELTEDEEFQKQFSEDKVLDELVEKLDETRQIYNEAYSKYDQRVCQLVVDYLLEHRDIKFLFFRFKLTNKKIKNKLRNILIDRMRSDKEFLRIVFQDGE